MNRNAIVYCEGAFNTANGKTAHGLVRFTERYEVQALIDSRYNGGDAGEILDHRPNGIKVYDSLDSAIIGLSEKGITANYFVIGLAPDGGRLPNSAKEEVKKAISNGLNIDSGLHDFLSEDTVIASLAVQKGVQIRDVRKTPPRNQLHFFTGDIEKVNCLKLAVLGTDSAIGKRTTAWILVHAFRKAGYKAEMIGTGQTAWMQGAKYGMIMDSCINDFVSGEIEHAIVSAWKNENPDVIIIEGQGSLMNPAYPGGFEILAGGRPDYVIMQHAPTRLEYDGFPGYELHSLAKQIEVVKLLSDKEVIAITLNHENMEKDEIPQWCDKLAKETGLPCFDVLQFGGAGLMELLVSKLS